MFAQDETGVTDLASLEAVVCGRVQGVFYRAFVTRWADELHLTGYVRNLSDGTVQVRAEGERERLSELIKHLEEGPPGTIVREIVTQWSEYTGNYSDFRIKR